jgi:hypothetical protein
MDEGPGRQRPGLRVLASDRWPAALYPGICVTTPRGPLA